MSNAPQTDPATEERRLLVERVVESRYFSKSARLRDLLLYVSNRVLRDGAVEIHEQEVGHKVFGREPDYDTASDNTVRVHASTLRKRLEQFFAAEGANEPITIELPKGNYAPVFRERSTALAVGVEPAEEPLPEANGRSANRWWPLLAAAIAGAAVASAVWLALPRAPRPVAGILEAKPTVRQFWGEIFRPRQSADLVLDDAAIGLYQELTGRTIGLSEYYDRGYLRGLDSAGSAARLDPETAAQIAIRRQSSFANVNALWRLAQVASEFGAEGKVVFARDYSFQSLKAGSAILFGNSRTNPWAEPFEQTLGVRWQFDSAGWFYFPVDTLAAAKDREQFHAPPDRRDGQDGFALAALVPNLRGTGRVLLLSATGGSALGAAADFLTDEGSMRKLHSRLSSSPSGRAEPFPSFEALLRVRSRSRRPEDVILAVCRKPAGPPPETPK